MTDNEIIKALEICSSDAYNDSKERCTGCKYDGAEEELFCFEHLEKDVLNLVKRQKTEIDILIRKKETLQDEICNLRADKEALINGQLTLQKMYVKAIKEFAERLKLLKDEVDTYDGGIDTVVYIEDIDNLVKEMTENKE